MQNLKKLLNKCFKDKNGHIVIAQSPNLPLIAWIVFEFASIIVSPGHIKNSLQNIATASLFIWAYLELTKGVNLFRKLFGLIVMAVIIYSYFVN